MLSNTTNLVDGELCSLLIKLLEHSIFISGSFFPCMHNTGMSSSPCTKLTGFVSIILLFPI